MDFPGASAPSAGCSADGRADRRSGNAVHRICDRSGPLGWHTVMRTLGPALPAASATLAHFRIFLGFSAGRTAAFLPLFPLPFSAGFVKIPQRSRGELNPVFKFFSEPAKCHGYTYGYVYTFRSFLCEKKKQMYISTSAHESANRTFRWQTRVGSARSTANANREEAR